VTEQEADVGRGAEAGIEDLGLDGAVIVLEGSINPAIFTPAWLQSEGLAGAEDVEKADVKFIDANLSRFDIGHCRVEARRDRVTVASGKALETYRPLADFVQGILEVLVHTPIKGIAMSRVVHSRLPEGRWEALAKSLIASDTWGKVLDDPGLETLTVVSRKADGATIEASVEASRLVPGGMYAVATRRVQWPDPMHTGRGARDALDALEQWSDWLEEANALLAKLRALS
jgi:hypothetical protein